MGPEAIGSSSTEMSTKENSTFCNYTSTNAEEEHWAKQGQTETLENRMKMKCCCFQLLPPAWYDFLKHPPKFFR